MVEGRLLDRWLSYAWFLTNYLAVVTQKTLLTFFFVGMANLGDKDVETNGAESCEAEISHTTHRI